MAEHLPLERLPPAASAIQIQAATEVLALASLSVRLSASHRRDELRPADEVTQVVHGHHRMQPVIQMTLLGARLLETRLLLNQSVGMGGLQPQQQINLLKLFQSEVPRNRSWTSVSWICLEVQQKHPHNPIYQHPILNCRVMCWIQQEDSLCRPRHRMLMDCR